MQPAPFPVHRRTRVVTSALMLCALLVSFVSFAPVPLARAASTPIYVKPGGTGNGSTWAQANDLAAALGAATAGTEIWVATGTYTPTVQTDLADPRSATFTLKDGVAIYGGFAGLSTETLATRDWATNVVTLSGDIGIVGTATDNSYHVVIGATGATLDGVTISGGDASTGSCPGTKCGGGMFNDNGNSPTLTNVIFSGNNAGGGGAMMNSKGSSPTLTNVTFSGNNAATDNGGAMYNDNSSNPVLTNVTFSGNSTAVGGTGGGGIYNSTSSPTLTNVTFSGNSAGGGGTGGGIYNFNSSPTLTNVTFSGNSATSGGGMLNYKSSPTLTNVTISGNRATPNGGGMYNATSSSPTLTNVTFSGNNATSGGGMYNFTSSSPTLTNVTFSGNSATSSGGGMYNSSSAPTLINVTFSGNSASNGGGMYNLTNSSPTLTNVTISGNSATVDGGGMYNKSSSNPKINNSIIWGNTLSASTTSNITNTLSTPAISTTLVGGSGGSDAWVGTFGTNGGGNLDADPKFVNPILATNAPTTTGDYRLQATSPAINTGNNAVITTTTDLDGNPRSIDGSVDMGAYEVQIPTVQSITRADPNPTNAATVTFTVTFNVNVSGVNDTDFTLTKTDGQNGASTRIASVSSSATPTTTWIVTVATTDLVSGTIRLDVVDDDSIINAAIPLVPLGRSGTGNGNFSSGEVYTVDRGVPTVVLSTSVTSPTNASTIPVTVTFSKDVTGFVQADLTVGNGTVSAFTPVSGSIYTFTLTPLADGVVTATVDAAVATDAVGNGNSAAITFSVTYARSSNATLSNLTLSSGTLSPAFTPTKTSYTVTVGTDVTSFTVTPTVSDTNATVTVNGTSAATPVTLIVGSTTITVIVTAQDGTTKTYTITVIRAGAAEVEITQSYKLEKGTGATAQPNSLAALTNTLTLTITVRNNGPDAVTGVVIADSFPAAAVGTVWRWTCTATSGAVCGNASGSGNLNETLGLLPKDGVVTFVVTGSLLTPNTWRNTPGVTMPTGVVDTITSNNSVTVTVGTFVTFVPLIVR